jgi:dihydroceramidase
MQLVDELSMIYTTCLMCYATFSFAKSTRVRAALMVGLVSLAVFITLYYHYLQDPTFHQNAYGILTAVIVFRSMWIMEVTLRTSWYHSHKEPSPERDTGVDLAAEQIQQEKVAHDLRILKTMWVMIAWGLSTFLGGFAIWNLDNLYCSRLVRWRRAVGLPWGILLEGHGWW